MNKFLDFLAWFIVVCFLCSLSVATLSLVFFTIEEQSIIGAIALIIPITYISATVAQWAFKRTGSYL